MFETLEYTPPGKTSPKVAIADSWEGDWNKPEEFRWIYVFSNLPAEYNQRMIGLDNGRYSNGLVVFYNPHTLGIQRFDISACQKIRETRPAKKPRRTKHYDWKWREGRWQKDWK